MSNTANYSATDQQVLGLIILLEATKITYRTLILKTILIFHTTTTIHHNHLLALLVKVVIILEAHTLTSTALFSTNST
jgi:hypothetical protein